MQPGPSLSGKPEEGDGMGRARGRNSRLGSEGVGSKPLAQAERVSIVMVGLIIVILIQIILQLMKTESYKKLVQKKKILMVMQNTKEMPA